MITPGAVARPSTCLRCQLRRVLLQARIRRLPQPRQTIYGQRNAFSTQPRRAQEADDQFVTSQEKPYKWRHLKSFGKVIGRPGRRQRVLSERLETNSLDKPANVIVLKDVQEEPVELSTRSNHAGDHDTQHQNAVTAKEIEYAINNRYVAPVEAEVNASIEALRPDETLVEEQEFEEHKKGLLKGYTFQQLSRYLVFSLRASATDVSLRKHGQIEGDVQELGTTVWHQGKTPLHLRRPKVTKKNKPYTKTRLVEQILRLAWHLTVRSELQGSGELEVKLQSWQASMLFDITHDDQPYYRTFIQSSGLLDSTQVQFHRPDHVMRVAGRRQDAEDVARQLKLGLLGVEALEFDFSPFSKILARENTRQTNEFFTKDELDYASDLTKCVIQTGEAGIVSIYGRTESARHNARRILLTLLDLSDTWITKGTLPVAVSSSDARINRVPVDISGLHRRHRGAELSREVADVSAKNGDLNVCRKKEHIQGESQLGPAFTAAISLESTIEKVSTSVQRLETASQSLRSNGTAQADSKSYWLDRPYYTDWQVDFARLLDVAGQQRQSSAKNREVPKANLKSGTPVRSIIQYQVPGHPTVLSYFEASRGQNNPEGGSQDAATANATKPVLVAHFVPSPSNLLLASKYPKLEMRFEFSSPKEFASQELLLNQIQATMDEQCLEVPLPEQSNDLIFSRRLCTTARLDLAEKDDGVRAFVSELRKSAQSNSGVLAASPELDLLLPEWLLKEKGSRKSASKDVPVKYLFERFEQVQRIQFKPRQKLLEREVDEDVKRVIQDMPRTMSIDYREVEAGAVYGSRTLLGLRNDLQHSLPIDQSSDEVEPPAIETTHLASSTSSTAATEIQEMPDSSRGQQRPQHQSTLDVDEDGRTVMETVNKSQLPRQDGDATNKVQDFVAMALSFANLFTRAASGSLRQYGRRIK